MTIPHKRTGLRALLAEEARLLTTIQSSDRPWQMPFAAALASGLPLLIGAWFGRLDNGLVSTLGGLVFLYLAGTPLSHRMVSLMACAFGMVACYTLGAMSHLVPHAIVPALTAITILVTMTCRFYSLGPPGSLFFVMAAAIAAYAPLELGDLPTRVGLLTLGCMLACVIGFCYSVSMLRRHAPKPVPQQAPPSFDYMVLDAVVIGIAVGASLAVAQALRLDKPYWVPVSCLAVIQSVSLRAVWTKQLHRVVGTGIGLILAWGLLSMPLNQWTIAVTLMLLSFLIEFVVVRNYVIASMLITPLTILLAEAAVLGNTSAASLIEARLIDTVLGCAMGLVGGLCLHSQRVRRVLGRQLRRLVPAERAS